MGKNLQVKRIETTILNNNTEVEYWRKGFIQLDERNTNNLLRPTEIFKKLSPTIKFVNMYKLFEKITYYKLF
jgi:hypothetical protein